MSVIRVDEKTVRVHDRLTVEGVRCLLEQTGFTEPLFVSDSQGTSGSSGTSLRGDITGPGATAQGVQLPFLSRDQAVDVVRVKGYSGFQNSDRLFHEQVLQRASEHLGVSVNDFRFTCSNADPRDEAGAGAASPQHRRIRRPLPVYTSTALQIGLLDNPNVPR